MMSAYTREIDASERSGAPRRRRLGLGLGVALAGCAPPNPGAAYPRAEPAAGEAGSTGVESVAGRAVDIRGLLLAQPYEGWRASVASDRLFFVAVGEAGVTLRAAALGAGAAIDPEAAAKIGELEGAEALRAILHAKGAASAWVIVGGAGGRAELARVDLASGSRAAAAVDGNVLGATLSEDGQTVVYLAATSERRCLGRIDGGAAPREVLCDGPALTFDGPGVLLSPDGGEVALVGRAEGDPGRPQVVAVDVAARRPQARVLTDPKVARGPIDLVAYTSEGLVFIADDEGPRNLFVAARVGRGREVRAISRFREDVGSAAALDAGIFAVHGSSATGSTLALVDPRSGRIVGQQPAPGSAAILGGHGQRVVWRSEAADRPPELHLSTITPASDGGAPRLADARIFAPSAAEAVRCAAEAARIPTFDVDPATGRTRELHALLLRPLEPASGAGARAVIRADGGGAPRYQALDHLLCAAGVTVVSPALRGASGLGRGFQALGERDLGGGEIADLAAVGRWTSATLGLEARQIGLWGEGRGAYVALRALTAGAEGFGFGFAAALGGAFDLTADPGGLPEWARRGLGDLTRPEVQARAAERSPALHLDRVQVPVFMARVAGDPEARPLARPSAPAAAWVELTIAGAGAQPGDLGGRIALYQGLLGFLDGLSERP